MRDERLFIVGPCGVGKTTVAERIESIYGLTHLNLDGYRRGYPATSSGCSLAHLDLRACLAPFLESQPGGFVIDVGGDTVFRRTVDCNEARLQQVVELKRDHGIMVVILDGGEAVVRARFLLCKSRHPDEFDGSWRDWSEVGGPWWRKCADRVVDTSGVRLDDETAVAGMVARVLG